jgi:hypothetical protein
LRDYWENPDPTWRASIKPKFPFLEDDWQNLLPFEVHGDDGSLGQRGVNIEFLHWFGACSPSNRRSPILFGSLEVCSLWDLTSCRDGRSKPAYRFTCVHRGTHFHLLDEVQSIFAWSLECICLTLRSCGKCSSDSSAVLDHMDGQGRGVHPSRDWRDRPIGPGHLSQLAPLCGQRVAGNGTTFA